MAWAQVEDRERKREKDRYIDRQRGGKRMRKGRGRGRRYVTKTWLVQHRIKYIIKEQVPAEIIIININCHKNHICFYIYYDLIMEFSLPCNVSL